MRGMEKNVKEIKKKRKIGGVLSALLVGTALATAGFINTRGTQVETYNPLAEPGHSTVLVYMDGSDLESDYGAATVDLKEMEQAVAKSDPTGEKIHIVIEAGGAAKWQHASMKPYRYGRFCITGKGTTSVTAMNMRDMGRADTLADFINYGTQSYPAEHYGLIFWNHGLGQIEGFGKDQNFEGSSLSFEDMKLGFEQSSFEKAFDFIGMDACLMSNLELVSVLQGQTEYLIASEDLEPQDGYDYKWMERLVEEKEGYGRGIGKAILETYDDYYKDKEYSYTLNLIDMSQYDRFHIQFDKVIEDLSLYTMKQKDDSYKELSRIRSEVQGFGQNESKIFSEQVDLMDMIEKMAEEGMCSLNFCQEMKEAYNQMIVSKVFGGMVEEPSGISIYLPAGANRKIDKEISIYQKIDFCQNYKSFVENYFAYLMKNRGLIWHEPTKRKEKLIMEVPKEQLSDIADAYNTIYIKKGTISYMIVADGDVTLDLSGYLIAPLENTFWGLKTEMLCLIEKYSSDDVTRYNAPILYKKAGGAWIECIMKIAFSDEMPDGMIEAIEPCELSKEKYFLEEGDEIIPLYPIYSMENIEASEEICHNNEYYKGNLIEMTDMEMGDGELEKIRIKDEKKLQYGFIIRDTKMALYNTVLVDYDSESIE